jgi:hypothetical protein
MSGTVFLHAGAPKTGSSAIQAALAQNRARLLQHGICYPESSETARARQGEVTSGNGTLISHLWLKPPGRIRTLRQNWSLARELRRHPEHDLLYSSEFIPKSSPESLMRLRDTVVRHGRQLKIIYYLRHLLDTQLAIYVQSLRAGNTEDLASFVHTHKLRYHVVIRRFVQTVGRENVILKLYDDEKRDLVGGFFSVFGLIDFAPPPAAGEAVVNRSFSDAEVAAMLEVNRILFQSMPAKTAKRLVRRIADVLAQQPPAGGGRMLVTEEEFRSFAAANAPVLRQVNAVAPFELKMKSDELQIGERAAVVPGARELALLSAVRTLAQDAATPWLARRRA